MASLARAAVAFAADVSGALFDASFRARALPRGALARTFLRLKLRRALLGRLAGMRLKHETLLGLKVAFRDHAAFAGMVRDIFLRQVYFFPCASETPRILDCGGNIGLATLFFKRVYPRACVTVFEPEPDNFALLKRNLAANGCGDVEALSLALGKEAGELAFQRAPGDPEGVNASLGSGEAGAAVTRVQVVPLSGWIDGPVDFLKMDIEGAEEEVIRELAASGRLSLVSAMAIEYHHHRIPGRDALAAFLAVLEGAGFGYRLITGESAEDPRGMQDLLIQAYRKAPGASP